MLGGDAAHQRISAGHHDSAAYAEQKEQGDDGAKAARAGQQQERDGDEGQPEHQADLVAFGIEQRAHAHRRDHKADGLRESDGAVLRRREMKAVRQIGQNGAEHGGNHSVDKNGENGGKDEHGLGLLRSRVKNTALQRW